MEIDGIGYGRLDEVLDGGRRKRYTGPVDLCRLRDPDLPKIYCILHYIYDQALYYLFVDYKTHQVPLGYIPANLYLTDRYNQNVLARLLYDKLDKVVICRSLVTGSIPRYPESWLTFDHKVRFDKYKMLIDELARLGSVRSYS